MTTTPSSPATERPQLPSPGIALGLLSDSMAHRAELAGLEFEEAREHIAGSTLLAGAAVILSLCTGFAVTLLVAGLVWDRPDRAWWLAGLCVLYLAGAAGTAFALSRRLRNWRPLGETQNQLQADYQCLNQLFKSIAP
ncbi:MAG TPA: phage holin family protein [Lacunisphaera sp.]|nr:phage holin family protein [Lacunisphaera sp.]